MEDSYECVIILEGVEYTCIPEDDKVIGFQDAKAFVEEMKKCTGVNFIITNKGILSYSCSDVRSVYYLARKKMTNSVSGVNNPSAI